jgi:hypothetical protein
MADKFLDFEESRIEVADLIDRVTDLQGEIRSYESRIENMESLLDRILICLNAYDNGESRHSLKTILDAIVYDIYSCRLQDTGSRFAEA